MQKYPYRDTDWTANTLAFDAELPRLQRSFPAKRANRLRISWFLIGLLAGIGLTAGITALFTQQGESLVAGLEDEAEQDVARPDDSGLAQNLSHAAVQAKPQAPRPSEMELAVGRGDTLSTLLVLAGAGDQETHGIVKAIRKQYNPRKLTVGQKVLIRLTPADLAQADDGYNIASVRLKMSPVKTLELLQTAKDKFDIKVEEAKLTRDMTSSGGKIKGSFYQAGAAAGLSPAMLSTLINAYSYDVDFQRDIKQGDSFQVIYETMRLPDGQVASTGKLLFASLTIGGQDKRIYQYTDSSGNSGFYDAKGNSVRKALLRTPINGARLSSGFGMRRHPILGYSKMHKGVDFAAVVGTPIYAAGDGIVEYSGRKGGYGNYVRIAHNNQYSTAYAHMSKIGNKARKGVRVRQGDIIGFVGTTGNSTGPHLHYEVLARGIQVNPKNIKFQTGNKLEGRELAAFKSTTQQLDQIASRMNRNEPKLARAN